MKIIVRVLKFVVVIIMGVSLSYLLTSCSSDSPVESGSVSADIIPVLPGVTIGSVNYDDSEIESAFMNTGTHARFASAYGTAYTSSLKETMIELISITIDGLGGSGANFAECCNSIESIKETRCLPCVAESAKYKGSDVWIIAFNIGLDENGLNSTAVYAVDKSSKEILYSSSSK